VGPRLVSALLGLSAVRRPDRRRLSGVRRGAEKAAYDHNNAKKSIEKESRIVDRYFQSSDYPALFWLSRALADEHEVLELGGSVGYAYYSFRRMMSYPERLRWTIFELPAAVRLGREIAAARGEYRSRSQRRSRIPSATASNNPARSLAPPRPV
jgi:hypothetical protein